MKFEMYNFVSPQTTTYKLKGCEFYCFQYRLLV